MSVKLTVKNKGDFEFFQDGKPVELQRENGVHVGSLKEEENGEVRFTVLRRSEFSSPFWFLECIIFWIIGIFGIFTPRYSRSTARVTSNLCLAENHGENVVIRMSALPARGKEKDFLAFEVKQGGMVSCDEWCFLPDPAAARRRTAFVWIFNVILRIVGLALCVAWIVSAI